MRHITGSHKPPWPRLTPASSITLIGAHTEGGLQYLRERATIPVTSIAKRVKLQHVAGAGGTPREIQRVHRTRCWVEFVKNGKKGPPVV